MDLLIVILLGLEFGSFANVCIYRWPLNLSVLYPRRSFCPWCKKKISWLDNFPLISFTALKGRCSKCRSPISTQYPIVEIGMAALWVAFYFVFKSNALDIRGVFFSLTLVLIFSVVVSTVTDLNWKIIPDELVVLMFVVFLIGAPWNAHLNEGGSFVAVQRSLLGAAVGGGLLFSLSLAGKFFFEKDALGWGDIKLMAAYGAYFGMADIILILFWGSIAGGVLVAIGLLSGRVKRQQYVPFAPFLNLGCLTVLFQSLSKL